MLRITPAPGEYYHIYNRGTEKRDIFLNHRDYERFLSLLYLCNDSKRAVVTKLQGRTLDKALGLERGPTRIDICAYCLMPNHFHLLVREKGDGHISKFMQKLTTGYTMYFNKLNERSGALFQGKYKFIHANTDNYLSYLISYIHLNPVKLIDPKWKENGIQNKRRAEKFLNGYSYSSYPDYLGLKRYHSKILAKDALPKYFETLKDFKTVIKYWLQGPTLE